MHIQPDCTSSLSSFHAYAGRKEGREEAALIRRSQM